MRKIYFAGSIRAGREDAGLYARLIAFLKTKGEVLTEHVGNPELLASEKDLSDEEIYGRDVAWIRASDILIAECTRPSLGVGYELAYAEALGKRCEILWRPSAGRLSAMLSGNRSFGIHPYADEREAIEILEEIFSK